MLPPQHTMLACSRALPGLTAKQHERVCYPQGQVMRLSCAGLRLAIAQYLANSKWRESQMRFKAEKFNQRLNLLQQIMPRINEL